MSRVRCSGIAASFLAAGVALALALPALADPPARVGRLSETSGVISYHPGDADQWSPAVANQPVTSGDSFWTEPGAGAEIRIGSTALQMDGATELDVAALDDHAVQTSLPQGTINIRMLHLAPGDGYTIATPRGTVTLGAPGTYHIDAGTDRDPTRVAVLDGRAQIVNTASTLTLAAGEAALITGTDTLSFSTEEAQPTAFDDAVLARERREEAERPAARYVSPEMTGAEDLDEYGAWRSEPSYGAVWYPQSVPAGWAPYRYGHWMWVAPWGWTWIDDQPWGFAPFHYGRWAYVGNRWGWVPGTVVARPVYAPALVTFIGGAGWSASLSLGQEPAVGWFPLAPREVYVPAYRASVTYVRNVNVTNVTNVTTITRTTIAEHGRAHGRSANRQFATVVPRTAFVGAHPIEKAAVAVPRAALNTAPVARTAPPPPESHGLHAGAPVRHPAGAHEAAAPAARPETPHADARPGPGAPGPAIAHENHPARPRDRFEAHPTAMAVPARPATPTVRQPTVAHRPQPPAAPHVSQPPGNAGPPHDASQHEQQPRDARPHAPQPRPAPAQMRAPPAPPERNVPHPVQQTVLQPTPKGWVRSPPPRAPAPPHPAPHPTAAPPQQQHGNHPPPQKEGKPGNG